jgi:glycosyltransferase involved in cell wall biosynthesis
MSAESTPAQASVRPAWQARALACQERVLPDGSVTVSCSAPVGGGGLGRHLQEILDALARRGATAACISEEGARSSRERLAATLSPGRLSPAWRLRAASVRFDRAAARRLAPGEHLIAFNGTALAEFACARRLDYRSRMLVSATAHMEHVLRQQQRACRAYPLERPWARWLVSRNLREYAQADRIYVSTEYIADSFMQAGVEDERLARFPLTPHPRFAPAGARLAGDTFDVVYVGGLTVDKGVALLIEAFGRLGDRDLRLVLVGGWKSRGMRRFIAGACARDRRITVRLGDPLEHLRRAAVCVHPAYCDGFAYAPAEAIACGVPVIVSEDTGMKELVGAAGDGLVVRTGDADALSEAISAAYRGELFRG